MGRRHFAGGRPWTGHARRVRRQRVGLTALARRAAGWHELRQPVAHGQARARPPAGPPLRGPLAALRAFGLLATVLAAIGLYAVTSFSVARRTREIGLRMSRLVGLRASDPGTLSAATLALLTVVLLAGYVPAPRATRVDPMVALRIE